MEYSLPHIAIITLFGLCAFFYESTSNEERKQQLTMVAIVSFYLFFAFRGYVYSDWTSYSYLLKEVEWEDILNIHRGIAKLVEPGFTLLCCLCATVTREYAFFVFVVTTIDVFLLLRFLKRWEINNIAFAFMLFMAFEGVDLMFNLVRNQIAIFIFLNALEYLLKRKPLPYFILCTFALTFHVSSLIFFPLYFVLNWRINKWVYLTLFCSFFLFFISKISLVTTTINMMNVDSALAEKAVFYTENLTTRRTLSVICVIENFLLIGLVFVYYDKLIDTFKGCICILNSLLLYFFFYYVFGEFRDFSSRLAMLFVFAYWVIWIYLYRVLYYENNKILMGCLLFLYIVYAAIHRYYMPIQEYDNLLFGGKSQIERLRIFNKSFEPDD